MSDMRILVTGGAGYIGSHTVRHLLNNGWDPEQIVVFDNLIYGHKEFVPPGVELVEADLLLKEDLWAVFAENQFDAVIHFAAYAYVGESMEKPGKYFENNVCGGLNLLRTMADHGCDKIIFSSTCATYGMPEKTPITEDMPTKPINAYGESKLMYETILQWFDKLRDVRHVALRYFNAAGADFGIGERHDPETHLIPLTIEAALGKRQSIKIFGTDYPTPDGSCIRDYIHVTDLADAHLKALNYLAEGNPSDYFNLGTGQGSSVKEIVDLVKEVSGRDFTVEEVDRRPGDPAVLLSGGDKAARTLGWKCERDIRWIIESAWDWHQRDNG